jgi:Fic family protein
LATVHDSYEYIPIRPNNILQLHRDLYSFSSSDTGGRFKNTDNVIAESGKDGQQRVRFMPVPAFQTPEAMEILCNEFSNAIERAEYDPLLLIPMFIIDFLCIHPFNDGNGRMSRLLTLLLLYRSGYIVGKYVSMEMLIEKTKETYYEALQESSCEWHEGTNDYLPFVRYMLGIITAAYREFSGRVKLLSTSGFTKAERIRELIKDHLGKITKAEIMELCPNISQATVQRTLAELLANGDITKIGGGRYTSYIWNGENK